MLGTRIVNFLVLSWNLYRFLWYFKTWFKTWFDDFRSKKNKRRMKVWKIFESCVCSSNWIWLRLNTRWLYTVFFVHQYWLSPLHQTLREREPKTVTHCRHEGRELRLLSRSAIQKKVRAATASLHGHWCDSLSWITTRSRKTCWFSLSDTPLRMSSWTINHPLITQP